MSATEILRRMLDECGVEWGNVRNDGSESDYLTEWQFEDNQGKAIAIEWAVGSGLSVEIHRYHLTPEQAIAATLDSRNCSNSERTGTCKADKLCDGYLYYTSYWCRGCDERFAYRPIGGKDRGTLPKFCPNCGCRIVDPTTNDVDAEVDA